MMAIPEIVKQILGGMSPLSEQELARLREVRLSAVEQSGVKSEERHDSPQKT
jgi:hypothetical protein